jgi:hypothetical protein
MTHLYRAHVAHFLIGTHGESDDRFPGARFEICPIIKTTPCGFWITCRDWNCKIKKRWVKRHSRFASATKAEAYNSLQLRKRSHVGYCINRLLSALKDADTVSAPLYPQSKEVKEAIAKVEGVIL